MQHIFVESNVIRLSQRFMCFGTPGTQFFMKYLYVLMSWPEDMDMLWIKFLSFVTVFCSANLSCSMIVHIFKLQRQT